MQYVCTKFPTMRDTICVHQVPHNAEYHNFTMFYKLVNFKLLRGYHSRCTWTAPTEIEFRCRTMIGVSAYLKIDNKKKKKNSRKKKVFHRHQKMSLFQLLNFKWLYFFCFYSCAQNFLNSYI
jgi:hypothetical protein